MVTTLSWIISISCIEYIFECVPTNRQFPRKLEVLPRKSNNENIKFLIVYFIPTVVENGISLYNQQMPVWGYLCWHCTTQRRIIIKITSVFQLLGGSLKVLSRKSVKNIIFAMRYSALTADFKTVYLQIYI